MKAGRASPSPVFGAVVVAALAATVTLIGVATGLRVQDEDEAVYVDTLRSMRAGEGYYPAMRDALVEKEGALPSQVRSIRPPTMFLVLRWFPEGSWRWLAGAPFTASLFLVWGLARDDGEGAALLAAALSFLWLAPASPYLFLHSEVWGLPFFLGGLLGLRRGREGAAAALVTAATMMRETYGLAILMGIVVRRRRAWLGALAVAGAAAAAHVLLAQDVLSPSGREPPLGHVPITPSLVLHALGPAPTVAGGLVGAAVLSLGVAGLAPRLRTDAAAAVLLLFALTVAGAGIIATRLYWSLTWGPALSAYAPAGAGLAAAWRRRRIPRPSLK